MKKFLLLGMFVLLFGIIWFAGIGEYFSLQAIAENQNRLELYVANNLIYSILIFCALYTTSVAFSIPGASILTLLGGLLFGGLLGGAVVVVAATLGAMVIFLIAKTSLSDFLKQKAGKWLEKIAAEFNDGAASYLLFLRLVPLFPFFIVNLAPALLGARFWTYSWTTFIGIMPVTFAYTFFGAGIGSILSNENTAYKQCLAQDTTEKSCEFNVSIGSIFSQELLIGFVAIGFVALIPIVLKKIKKAKAKNLA